MYNITAYKMPNGAIISQSPVKRDWMDKTHDKHAYQCFPLSLTNSLGWSISYPKDISFILESKSGNPKGMVTVIEGHEYCNNSRMNSTISFKTGINLLTEKDVTCLIMPVPNQFIDGVQCFTTLLSTSFFNNDLPVVWMVTKFDEVITIKAGTPVASIIPIPLGKINNSEITIKKMEEKIDLFSGQEYADVVKNITMGGKWSNFYRNGTDHLGNKIGDHETKTLRFKVNE
jgi:Family of unknown function (DUF6065)